MMYYIPFDERGIIHICNMHIQMYTACCMVCALIDHEDNLARWALLACDRCVLDNKSKIHENRLPLFVTLPVASGPAANI